MKFSMTGQEKVDLLIEVTGLTVFVKTQETSITSCIHIGLDKQSNKGFHFFFETITIKDNCFYLCFDN
jgi:hypothetical protein